MLPVLGGARRPQRLVNRKAQLEQIQAALSLEDDAPRVVLLRGAGGLGKTRLLEEVLARCQPEQTWNPERRLAVTKILDLVDIHLHTRRGFLQGLREGLRAMGLDWVQFPRYDAAMSEYRQKMLDNVDYARLSEAADETYRAFWRDYREITQGHRMIWLVDTAEQLAQSGMQWFLSEHLLEEDWVENYTGVWLRRLLRNPLRQAEHLEQLRNTTLILAGRGEEGAAFFEEVEKACEQGGVEVISVEMGPFSEEEVREYIAALKEEASPEVKPIYEAILKNEDMVHRLHVYTGGQPVLLALFSDLLLEGNPVPEALRLGAPLPESKEALEQVRWELEEEILNQLFRPSGKEGALRQDILLALVRAPEGLSAEQLHYVLDNLHDLSPEEWAQTPEGQDTRRVAEIEAVMKDLLQLAIVKRRPGRKEIQREGRGEFQTEAAREALRIGLQDEVFRIFANHMAPHVRIGRPVDEVERREREQLDRLMQTMGKDTSYYEVRYRNEVDARERLYRRLRDWAAYQKVQYEEALYQIRREEERSLTRELERATPASPRLARLKIPERDRRKRSLYREVVRELELEHMIYAFLLNPDREMNESYVDVGDQRTYANDEAGDMMTSELIWRLLHDRYTMRFVPWNEVRPVVKERGEHTLDTLRRALRQEHASRWIKRLALQRRLDEAEKFKQKLEEWIAKLPKEKEIEWRSWTHTLVQSEREVWIQFGRMFPAQGKELEEILKQFEDLITPLRQLAQADTKTPVIKREDRSGNSYRENGFRGHPAYLRLRRVISMASTFAGYIATQLGNMADAERYYNLALAYLRETGMVAHRALLINNLSRLLAERGQPDALELCKNALNLRLGLGADQPIGLSHSTMALIYNRRNQPELAWQEAAKARLYFSRVEDPRGIGLASIQLGEALRMLGGRVLAGDVSISADVRDLFEAARDVLDEALGIFGPGGEVDEPLRYLEALIEKGCLYRECLRVAEPEMFTSHYGTARSALTRAREQARQEGWFRLELDAAVNLAWTHYIMGKVSGSDDGYFFEQAEKEIAYTLRRIHEHYEKPLSGLGTEKVEPFVWYQASKLYGLKARLAMDEFRRWVEQHPERKGVESRVEKERFYEERLKELEKDPHGLDQAAQAWLQSLGYAYRFERCSIVTPIVFAGLYGYLKQFNEYELKAFVTQVKQAKGEEDEESQKAREDILHFMRTRLGLVEDDEE